MCRTSLGWKMSLAAGWLMLAVAPAAMVMAADPPLVWGHAHNDYYHQRPLEDALAQGFCSVEADVFLEQDQLLVGHGRQELRPERSLRALYLEPLRMRLEKNGGQVHAGQPTFYLLIDIKSDGEATYAALRELLREYRGMLSHREGARFVQGPVTAIVSGNRAVAKIAADATRAVGVDGRVSDLDGGAMAVDLMPWISDSWAAHFQWRGAGEMPPPERARLEEIVRRTHAAGRQLRFWATPEDPAVWRVLRAAGVDWIGTDQLAALRTFQEAEGRAPSQ